MSSETFFQALTSGLLSGGLFALVAVGLTMILGVLKIINFAHGESLMLGMYITYYLCTLLNMDPYLTLIITIPLFFIIGMVIQRGLINPILDSPMEIQVLLTLGLFFFLQNLALLLFGPHLKSIKTDYALYIISLGSVSFSSSRLIMFLFSIIFTTVLYIFLKKTDLGKAIRARSNRIGSARFLFKNAL